MRIGFLIGQLGQGGAERQVYLIASALQSLEVTPIVFTFDSTGLWAQRLKILKIPVFTFPRHHSLDIDRLCSLRQSLRDLDLSVLFCFGPAEAFYGRLAAFGVNIKAVPNLRNENWGDRLGLLSDYFLSTFTTHYVVNSSIGERYLQQTVGIRPEKITYIGNAVDTTPILKASEPVRDPRPSGFSLSVLWCGWVGSFYDRKDPALLLDICEITSQQMPEVHYLMVGDGPLRIQTEEAAAKRGLSPWVAFTGNLENASQVWKYLDFGLSTSQIEGTPNVLFEAMMYGKPYIAPPVGDYPYWIEDNKNGLLCKSRNPTDMAERVIEIAQNAEFRQMLALGAKLTSKVFPSSLQVAQNYLNLAYKLTSQALYVKK